MSDHLNNAAKDPETRLRREGQETRDVTVFKAHFLTYFTGEHDPLVPTSGPQLKCIEI